MIFSAVANTLSNVAEWLTIEMAFQEMSSVPHSTLAEWASLAKDLMKPVWLQLVCPCMHL